MRDLYNLHEFYSESSKQLNNRRKSFGYQVLGFGSGGGASFAVNDNGIFGYGNTGGSDEVSMTNLVANTGVVATDTSGVGQARYQLMACQYGGDKGIFGYGTTGGATGKLSMTNLVSNSGVVGSDVTGVGTARMSGSACSYDSQQKGIFAYGENNSEVVVGTSNLVSDSGVVATDVSGFSSGV